MDLEKIRAAAERVAQSEGLEVVDVEWKAGRQRFLRVYIDRPWTPDGGSLPQPEETLGQEEGRLKRGQGAESAEDKLKPVPRGGISHRECEAVSQQLSVILDVEDLVPGARYVLEVSSPGLDRKLVKPMDFLRFAGRQARISLAETVENSKFFEGRLAGYEDEQVKLEVKGRVVALPIGWIRKANLVVEF